MARACPSFVQTVLQSAAPVKVLTLAIVNQGGRVLLGEKKRGFGEGYFNGFGGKVEAGETVQQAAIRELKEEAGITPVDIELRGVLTFIFDDQERPWEVHVYHISEFTDQPTESDEMRPVWFDHREVPFTKMWADDEHWYPLFLAGYCFEGVFAFRDTHSLVWHELRQLQAGGPGSSTARGWLQKLELQ